MFLPWAGGGHLEGIVEAQFNIQVHAFHLRFFWFGGSLLHELLLTSFQR